MTIAIYRDILKLFEGTPKTDVGVRVRSGARDEGERRSNGRIVVSHASYGPNRSPHRGPVMATSETAPGVRPLIAPMRWLLYAASALVFLAGFQLTVFSEQTATYFAWTIARPLTAAFLGASYWAAVPVEIIAARQSMWASARVAVPAIWLFTTLTLVTTLLHFDLFHFSSPVASARAARTISSGSGPSPEATSPSPSFSSLRLSVIPATSIGAARRRGCMSLSSRAFSRWASSAGSAIERPERRDRGMPESTQSGMKTASTSSSEDRASSGRAARRLSRTRPRDDGGGHRNPRAFATGRGGGANPGVQSRRRIFCFGPVLLRWPGLSLEEHRQRPCG